MLISVAFLLFMLPLNNSTAWVAGDEKELFGHTFEEESWYTTVENKTKENDTAEFGISFINFGDIEAFLITMNQVEDDEGNRGVLPYQMFGMHYYTEEGKEVFIGALLAFLCVWEDADNNTVPSAGEKFFYVIPFGAGNVVNGTYPPTVTNHQVEKISEDHYKLGITYRNMYAIATENPLATAYLATGWVLQFSELTITYDIRIDRETGELTSETYYTVGQITTLYAVILGIPIPANDIQGTIPDNFGFGAVHFTTIFSSNYRVLDKDGSQLNTNRDQVVEGDINLSIGDSRAFSVGFRGDYDLKDELNDTMISEDMPAKNMIMKAKFNDLLLVAWQLDFSAKVFASMAYGLSSQIRSNWETPGLLVGDSTKAVGAKGFGSQAFWYGVFFPQWEGYRIIHDPVYTAYFGDVSEINPEKPEIEDDTPGFELLLLIPSILVATFILVGRKRK
jgi:hypothetical protein